MIRARLNLCSGELPLLISTHFVFGRFFRNLASHEFAVAATLVFCFLFNYCASDVYLGNMEDEVIVVVA